MTIKKAMTLKEILEVFPDEPFMLQTKHITLYNLTSDMFVFKELQDRVEYRSGNLYFRYFDRFKIEPSLGVPKVTYYTFKNDSGTGIAIEFENLYWMDFE